MKDNKDYPNWLLWIYERAGILFVLGGVFILCGIIGSAWYLDQRIEQVEDRLQHVPPRSYQTPNLNDYSIGDTKVDELPIRQLVYVPVYSHAYYQGGAPYSLETTLSIRNIDPQQPIFINKVQYFDTNGELVKTHLESAIRIRPLQTIEFLVERRDSSGGSGANFLVEWLAESKTNRPLIEAVMIGSSGTQAISFSREGIEISEATNPNN